MMSDDSLLFYGLTILFFLLMSAFFSASETALTAVTRSRIYQLVIEGNRRARAVNKLKREKETMLSAILLGNNAVNIAASALATTLAIKWFGEGQGMALATLVMTLLIVVFTEVLPKTYAIQNTERTALALAPALGLIVRLLYPVTFAIQLFIRLVLRLFGVDITQSRALLPAADVIRGTIELHHHEGRMVKLDRDMLGSILDLSDIEVGDIMIHRQRVETLDADLPASELIRQAVGTMHSRIPLWRGEADNIVGVLHVKNLIKALNDRGRPLSNEEILAVAVKPWFIPETTRLRHQLLAFRAKRQHLAIVVDEYGAWQGIVTLEDIIEEIVGDIGDEHDEATSDIQKIGDNAYLVSGGVTLRDLNRQLDWNLPDDRASTAAGLLIEEAEAIPAIGGRFDLSGYRFTVLGKDATRITRLRIEKLPKGETEDETP